MTSRRFHLLALLGAVAPLALSVAARAQQAEGTPFDTITVVGTRTAIPIHENPRTVGVVRQKEIERQAPESIARLIEDMPGVEVADESVAGMKRLRIRGESSRRVTVLIDGQEITDHSTYGTPLLIDPAGVERIEVVRGPNSVLFGAKAIGGVINIVTKRGAANKPVQLEVGGSLYSVTEGRQGFAAVSGTLGAFDYRFSASTDRHEDRDVPKSRWAPTGKLENTAYSNQNYYGHLGYRFGADNNHYLAVKVEQHKLSSRGWSGVAVPGQTFSIDLPKRDRTKIGLFYDWTNVSPLIARVHADVYYQTIDRIFKNDVSVQTTPTRSVAVKSTSDDTITNIGGGAQIDLTPLENHYAILGVQALTDRLDTAKSTTSVMTGFGPRPITSFTTTRDRAKIDTFSAYAQDEWKLPWHFKLTAGARLYHTRTELTDTTVASRANAPASADTALVKSIGLTWSGLTDTVLRASYAEGFITPTLLQRYSSTTAGGQGTTYGNPNLKSETSHNFEVGARYRNQALLIDVAGFYSKARNYITTTRCVALNAACASIATPASGASYYINADRATTYGVEALAEYTIGESGFTPYVSGAAIRRETEQTGLRTFNSDTPLLSGRVGVRYETTWHSARVWSDLFVRGGTGAKQTYFNSSGVITTDRTPAWSTLNFAVGTKFGPDDRYLVSLSVNNILNQAYRPTLGELPGAGRNVELTARLRF